MHRRASPPLRKPAAVICHVEGALLRSSSCFPYFMVVALENGSLLRALLLLSLYPFLSLLGEERGVKVMSFISFCGVRVGNYRLGVSVLPKHFIENLGREGFEILMAGKKKVCVSRMPKIMVEEFLRKYLKVEVVVAREMKMVLGFYTGVMEEKGEEEEVLQGDGGGVLGLTALGDATPHPLFSLCKVTISIPEAEKKSWRHLPKEYLPEPLIFHDGRLAFFPTSLSSLAMLVWFPFSLFLLTFRLLVSILLPCSLSTLALALSGMTNRVVNSPFTPSSSPSGRLFVSNHRTLMDPIVVFLALSSPVTAVVYGVSILSRFLSPIKTVVLTRSRERDGYLIKRELTRGDVVICPEGTTCREPFLLRFSPLFAEISKEVRPVAMNTRASMFYGTTAGGTKWLDPFFVLLNPYTLYTVEFLEKVVAREGESSCDMANRAQEAIASALGFHRTKLTRKDKYLALAGNDGM